MSRYYVVGGKQRGLRTLRDTETAWSGYEKGLVLEVDTDSGDATLAHEYASPPDVHGGDEAAISFQAGHLDGHLLYLCTETEVLVYEVPRFRLVHYVSLPWFNDVHHVRPTPDGETVVVASAGLELVLETTLEGEVRRTWNVLGEDPWARFDKSVDYRLVASTKPHRSHPNYLFYLGEELWATRFHQGDAVSLTQPGRSIRISDKRIHDGVLDGDHILFTTVDGTIVVVDREKLQVMERIDLNSFHRERVMLGWCRAIRREADILWVGFSRIRPTRFRENVGWAARGLRRGLPTRIACYDLGRGRLVQEVNLEPVGLSAVYSILPVPSAPQG